MCQWITTLPHLSNGIYESMKHIAKFKADMQRLYIRVHKDLTLAWTSLRFIVINDVINGIVDTWPLAWRRLAAVERDEAAIR